VEYKIGSTYVKALGVFDVSGPAPANWRAEIPRSRRIFVEYQLFTRNEFGQELRLHRFQLELPRGCSRPCATDTFGAIKPCTWRALTRIEVSMARPRTPVGGPDNPA